MNTDYYDDLGKDFVILSKYTMRCPIGYMTKLKSSVLKLDNNNNNSRHGHYSDHVLDNSSK